MRVALRRKRSDAIRRYSIWCFAFLLGSSLAFGQAEPKTAADISKEIEVVIGKALDGGKSHRTIVFDTSVFIQWKKDDRITLIDFAWHNSRDQAKSEMARNQIMIAFFYRDEGVSAKVNLLGDECIIWRNRNLIGPIGLDMRRGKYTVSISGNLNDETIILGDRFDKYILSQNE